MKKTVLTVFVFAFLIGTPVWADFKIGLVLDKGGKDDKSFNASAYRGAMRAKDELNAQVKYVEATDDNAFEPVIRNFARRGFDLIVCIGVSQAEAVTKVAKQFPEKSFVIVDGEAQGKNVRSILFKEHEGSYLVGAIAGMISKTAKVGFIGGMDIPLIRRFEVGFSAGAKAANPKADVTANYVGMTASAWNNPAKGKELAKTQYDAGVDIIFAAAGASNTGVFDAAEEEKKFAIGVDSNQNGIKPGRILTSMVKRIDEAVFQVSKASKEGAFSAGVHHYGLEDKGVDYIIDSYNEELIPGKVREKVEELRKKIIEGKLEVPDYYKNRK